MKKKYKFPSLFALDSLFEVAIFYHTTANSETANNEAREHFLIENSYF